MNGLGNVIEFRKRKYRNASNKSVADAINKVNYLKSLPMDELLEEIKYMSKEEVDTLNGSMLNLIKGRAQK